MLDKDMGSTRPDTDWGTTHGGDRYPDQMPGRYPPMYPGNLLEFNLLLN